MRIFLGTLLTLAILGFGGATTYLAINERQLVFHPAERAVASPPMTLALRERNVAYASGDGTRLSAWVVPGTGPDSVGYWMLICHGNYGNIGYGDRPAFYASARDLGLNLLAFDYRGFGESEGSPEEQGLYADAEASYRYLTDSLHVPANRIVIFGHSLGSGVAIELATRVPAAALVVEGAYTSVVDRGQELYPFLPVRFVASQRFASIEKVGRLSVPKLFLHSPTDNVIPFAHGERLFAAATSPKQFVSVVGGHMESFKQDKATYFGAIRTLVTSLDSTAVRY
ncbi:MAG: alpha/beta hydrolase [Cytophagaceae bacterium]|nr:alpha/beta hydrolase [Gemmatimonadaceae bacterium]